MVSIGWFGVSCFEIDDSVTVVTDPHDKESLGLKRPNIKGDVVTVSHRHFDHASGKELVLKEDGEVVDEAGRQNVKGVEFEGISNEKDDERGRNIYFVFELDGFRICHLGDLGYRLTDDNAEEIRPVDILLVPIGGTGGHEGQEAVNVVDDLDPAVVVPMHYMVEDLNVRLSEKDEFLELMEERGWKIRKKEKAVFSNLPEEKEIIELDCQALG